MISEDMEASKEIKEKGILWKTKLSSKIKKRNSNSIQVDAVSRNIQLIDASKKAYGTVAYLLIKLDDGNIISSFVALKSRVALLKTLSIPRLEFMGAFLSERISRKIEITLELLVSRFYWTDRQ
ncbi:integrase catalytic domain-containing protein [Nephila pilipes]|uniref:Integrase catalytic domain-containing protein n=1 Tax=Nephila pilipes TaxID=299642 RepID=A0A8X6N456_NEPPI|nr:integrase catalytic domain-containing protein [Nephila pilipes]